MFYANPECLMDTQWFINKDSLNSNFKKVFGDENEYFADLLFYYLSDGHEMEKVPLYYFVK
eukprot:CAMPEP_0168321180 /NCGR_PEP_ID=MMETSP0213-20121227/2116_1 /TAXON_ID=151035 /ORGANISM="Euplotes harpa, Strain FSP1.4" /LENGTH=60 /DNA_ID=CAMNT_0008322779 /DNA_START=450 /DNA_END=632 /DNA_ORIENTATION=+